MTVMSLVRWEWDMWSMDEVSESDDEISEADMMSEKSHETDEDELDEISVL